MLALAEPVENRTQLLELLNRHGLTNAAGRPYTTPRLAQLLDEWRAAGVVDFDSEWTRLRCDGRVAHACMTDPSLQPLSRVVQDLSAEDTGYGFFRHTDRDYVFLLRSALYMGDAQARDRCLAEIRDGSDRARAARVWRRLLGETPAPELMGLIPDAQLPAAFDGGVIASLETLQPIGDAWDRQLSRVSEPSRARLSAWLGMARLLSGREGDARELLASSSGCEAEYARAAFDVFFGSAESARERAARAIAESRGNGRRKPALRGPGAPWAALALVLGNPAELAEGSAVIDRALARKNDAGFPYAYMVLRHLADILGRGHGGFSHVRHTSALDQCFGAVVFGGFELWSIDRALTYQSEALAYYEALAPRAERSGYGLLAAEVRDALARVRSRKAGECASRLASLRTAKARWEQVLESLERAGAQAVSDEPTSAEEPANRRLVWDFALYPGNRVELAAREQTRKSGGWSSGRAVALSRLGAVALEHHAGPQDRRIIGHLCQRTERPYGRRQVVHEWGGSVMRDVVGHPAVYDAHSGERLEVVAEKPTLELLRNDDGLELVVRPEGLARAGVVCVAHPGRVEVYEVSEETALVARTLRERVAIPRDQEARVQKIVGTLARTLRVESDAPLGSELAAPVAADPRIRVLCWRSRPGLRVRIAVRPLGDRGPALEPGRGSEVVAGDVDSQALQTRRDLGREAENLAALLDACPTLAAAEHVGRELRLRELSTCYEALTELWRLADAVVIEWPRGQPLTVVGERELSDLRVKLSSTSEWLRADVRLEVDEGRVLALRELLALLATASGRFVELGEDRIIALSNHLKEKLERLTCLGNVQAKHIDVPARAAPVLEAWLSGIDRVDGGNALAERLARIDEAERLEPVVPRTFQASLRDYQLDGFVWMRRLAHWGGGPLLCDDMGLGKTIQLLALLADTTRDGPGLVVAPTSVCGHWEEQAARFAPSLTFHRLGNGDRQALVSRLGAGDVLLASYGLLQREAELLSGREFAVAILDEAQAIKNASSRRARAAHGLIAPLRVVSSGTPVENHLGELWSLFEFANPGLLGSAARFERLFARPIQERGDRRALDVLKQLVRPFILRRTKSEVLEQLPDKTEITLRVELGAEERALYEAVRREALDAIDSTSDPAKRRMVVFTMLTRLRQAACHPRLVHPEHAATSSKHEALLALVDELRQGRHRALVFSQFVEQLRLVRQALDAGGIPHLYLDGSTPAGQRPELVRRFQAGEGDLFLISLRAGGTGLDLTGADYVVHLDPWWNPAVETQAGDRAHRIGQRRPVTIYRLVAAGTVEERILAMHGKKRETAERLLDGTGSAAHLDVDALRELIAGLGD